MPMPLGLPPTDCLLLRLEGPEARANPNGLTQLVFECPPDLAFSSIAPGGYDALTCTIPAPGGIRPLPVAAESTVQVIDRRNAQIVWHGHIIDPGSRYSSSGTYRVSAHGFQTVLDTEGGVLAYMDRDLSRWYSRNKFARGSLSLVQDEDLGQHNIDPAEPQVGLWLFSIPEGAPLKTTPSNEELSYVAPAYIDADGTGYGSGQSINKIYYSVRTNSGSANVAAKGFVTAQSGATKQFLNYTWATVQAGGTVDEEAFQSTVTSDNTWPSTQIKKVTFKWEFVGATGFNATADVWQKVGNLAVQYSIVNIDGAAVDSAFAITTRRIVEDVIGRWLRQKLEITAAVDLTATVAVDQAAWFDGISARGVFDFIDDLEGSARYWAVWGPGLSGKPEFEWRPWNTYEPRYLVPPQSGEVDLAGGAEQLVNRAVVTYQTAKGVPASAIATGYVQELDAAGLTRTAVVDATGSTSMTKAQALAFGRQAIARQDIVKLSGTASVTGPVLDRLQGRWIEPWEMRAGWLAVFGGADILTRGSAVVGTDARDSKSVWRVTSTNYGVSSASCDLALDGGGRTSFRRVKRTPPTARIQTVDGVMRVANRIANGGV